MPRNSEYRPLALDGDPKGASVLILGAGLAGMTAALELRKAGYKVRVLEYNDRAGGRTWTIRGGDRYVEMGGFAQKCEFDRGLYINPGPWRIPFHHHGLLDYCKRLKVALEPFVQVNYNAYLHSKDAFGGKPQRYRHIAADFNGGIAELLAKATAQGKLDDAVSTEDKERLLAALKGWGALDKNYAYVAGVDTSERRGYDKDPGGGLDAVPMPSTPIGLTDILKARIWQGLVAGNSYDFLTTMFQPVGGMDMIAKAFVREVGSLIRYNAKVTAIHQDDHRVTVTFTDTKKGGAPQKATADWCLCTIPLSILSQIEINVGAPMAAAIASVPYMAGGQGRAADEAPLLGRGRGDLRRHHHHRSADPHHRLSLHRLLPSRQGRALGRLRHLQHLCLRVRRAAAGRARGQVGRMGRDDPSAIQDRVRERRRRRVAAQSRQSRLLRQLERGRCASSITTRCARSTAASRSPASMRPTCRRGRKARSCQRSMPSRGSTAASWRDEMMRRLVLIACALAAAGAARADDAGFGDPAHFTQQSGAALYHGICQGCHMPQGQGAKGAGAYPALAHNQKLAAAGYPVLIVLNGSKGMPAFGRMLDDAQVAAVVNYVRTNFGNAYADAVSPADVAGARK